MTFSWSPEKEALFRFETDIVVSASAGTGKTTALVELMARLAAGETALAVEGGIGVDNILAITFTNKAARQMRDKLAAALRERGLGGGDAIRDAYIHTFHAFCARLLREHAFEAGLSPDFKTAEEADARSLLDRAAADTLAERLERGDADAVRLAGRFSASGLAAMLIRLILAHQGWPVRRPSIPRERRRLGEDLKTAYRLYGDELTTLADVVASNKTTPLTKQKADDLAAHWRGVAGAGSLPDADAALAAGLAFFKAWREALSRFSRLSKPIQPWRVRLDAIRERAQALFCQIHALPERAALAELAQRARRTYRERKRQAGVLDFDDLQVLAIRLLRRRPEIRRRVQRQFHAILVDEAQDTNRTQMELLRGLVRRDAEAAGALNLPPTRFLVVGDRKQSIYRFRGADVSVFAELERRVLAEGGRRLSFAENFRSVSTLLDFYNGLFPRVMAADGEADFEVAYGASDDLSSGLNEATTLNARPVELLANDAEGDMPARRLAEARRIAVRLKAIFAGETGVRVRGEDGAPRPPTPGDAAILLRRMTHAAVYEQALRETGLPYAIAQSTGFYARPEVRDLIHLVRFLVQPHDAFVRAAVLRSPAVLLSDLALLGLFAQPETIWSDAAFAPENWAPIVASLPADEPEKTRLARFVAEIHALRARLPLLPVSELLEESRLRFDLAAVAALDPEGARLAANQEKLVDLARLWERERPGFGPSAFCERIETLRRIEAEEGESPVARGGEALRVMTLHQAKGLEFPIVVFPDLSHRPMSNRDRLVIAGRARYGLKLAVAGEEDDYPTWDYLEAKDRDRAEEEAEYKRLLYVGLTRARDYLILSGDVTRRDDRDGRDDGGDEKRRSWYDWIAEAMAAGTAAPDDDHPPPTAETATTRENELHAAAPAFRNAAEALAALADATPPPVEAGPGGTFSVSLLQDLTVCERRFQLRRLLDRTTLLWVEPSPDESPTAISTAADAGKLVHEFYETRDPAAPIDVAAWKAFLARKGLSSEKPEFDSMGRAIAAAGDFPAPPRSPDAALHRELPFLAALTLPSGRSIRLKGRIDAARTYPDGGFDLVDYKYAARNPERAESYRFQLLTYAAVLRAASGGAAAARQAAVAYLQDRAPWRPVDVNDSALDAFLTDLEQRLSTAGENEAKAFVEWSDAPPDICRRLGCPYLSLCGREETKTS
ncbi:MAG: hypothetical protein C4523_09125 [Myxococcales bacterium]|nr:MAG: hypothetical protein C4523_09125 [Myxococcales bacterium]